MSNLAQNVNDNQLTFSGGYYAQVMALTPKETNEETRVSPITTNPLLSWLFTPLLMYGTVILFFGLFIGALIIQIIKKSLDMKRTLTSLVVAIVIASIPLTLKTALEVTTIQSKAETSEIPRHVELIQSSASSLSVRWETETEKLGAVRFGQIPFSQDKSHVVIANMGKKTTKHEAILEDLVGGFNYELEILSGAAWYNDSGKAIQFHLDDL